MSLALHTHTRVEGVDRVGLFKVLEPEEAARSSLSGDRVLLWESEGPTTPVASLRESRGA